MGKELTMKTLKTTNFTSEPQFSRPGTKRLTDRARALGTTVLDK